MVGMDNRRFDQLAKLVSGAAGSRREALRAAFAGGLAAALGIVGAEESEADKRERRRRRRERQARNRKRKQRRRRRRNRCTKTNRECNTNRPSACCSQKCCFDNTSSTDGVCADGGGTCCTFRQNGGYCPQANPQCCGSASCCAASGDPGNSVCCASPQTGIGFCCPAGSICDFNLTNPCVPPDDFTLEPGDRIEIGSPDIGVLRNQVVRG